MCILTKCLDAHPDIVFRWCIKYKNEHGLYLNLRVDEIVKSENFMEKVIVEAAKNSTNDTNQRDRDYISYMVSISNMTHIKHD